MSDKKDKKLDFDLDFLDEESPIAKQTAQAKSRKKREGVNLSKWNWKVISIVGVVILVAIWLFSSDDGSYSATTPTVTPSTNQIRTQLFEEDTFIIGEFSCSRYHYNRAVELSSSENEQQMDNALASLKYRANELDRLSNEIEYSYVSDYSPQYEIDAYNADVEQYNSKLADYQWDADALDTRVDRYNNQVETHNNYLEQNCTPRK